ncbi:MAG: hypothetical protein IJU92_00855 [Spirochaetaceae bacterium]|nr:hypothetical protein [Spirochaetaceae bacterium]
MKRKLFFTYLCIYVLAVVTFLLSSCSKLQLDIRSFVEMELDRDSSMAIRYYTDATKTTEYKAGLSTREENKNIIYLPSETDITVEIPVLHLSEISLQATVELVHEEDVKYFNTIDGQTLTAGVPLILPNSLQIGSNPDKNKKVRTLCTFPISLHADAEDNLTAEGKDIEMTVKFHRILEGGGAPSSSLKKSLQYTAILPLLHS